MVIVVFQPSSRELPVMHLLAKMNSPFDRCVSNWETLASIDDVYVIMVPRTWSTLFADHRMNSEFQYLRGVSTPMSEGLIIYYNPPPVLFFRESLNKPNAKHFVSSILSSPFQSKNKLATKKNTEVQNSSAFFFMPSKSFCKARTSSLNQPLCKQ